jgi:nucleoside-diphosphate-sugar epimerase
MYDSYPSSRKETPMASKLIIGCGYLGLVVAKAWIAAGHHVMATTRRVERFAELQPLGIEPVLANVLDQESLGTLPTVPTVLYCVGLDRATGDSMRTVYVDGLANVLGALRRPVRFLYVSSTSVYGQTHSEEVDEGAATEPSEEAGRIVLEAEMLLRERLPEAIILRLAGIYGPGRLLSVAAIKAGTVLARDPDRLLNLIHVEDGARAIVAADECGRPGAIYNVSDGQPVTRREFYTSLARLVHAPPPQFAPRGSKDGACRRIVNRKILDELGVELRYPGYVSGLAACALQ